VVFSAPKEEEIDDVAYVSMKRVTTSAQSSSTQDDAMEVVTTANDNGKRAREGETKDENDAAVQESDAKRKKVQQRNVEVACEYRFWNADTKHRSESADEQEEVDLGTGTTCPVCVPEALFKSEMDYELTMVMVVKRRNRKCVRCARSSLRPTMCSCSPRASSTFTSSTCAIMFDKV
jgi:hypothetical protein